MGSSNTDKNVTRQVYQNNILLSTYINESEHDGHCVGHHNQLTAVHSTASRDGGPVRVKVHLGALREEKGIKSATDLWNIICISSCNSVFMNIPLLA